MTKILDARVTVYTGTASQWASADVVLLNGEWGYATDSKVLKIGDGVKLWSQLPKAVPQGYDDWGGMDSTPIEGSNKPVTSGGLYTAFAQVQASLQFDDVPTEDSANPVKSGGIFNALAEKIDIVDIVDGLDSTSTDKPLSAKQGKVLRELMAGLRFAKSFATIEAMITHLNSAAETEYFVGYNFYIEALDVPDFWVTEVKESSSNYTYSSDTALINAVKAAPVQIGYYKISLLETAKVDLADYAKTSEVTAAISDAVSDEDIVRYSDELIIICGGNHGDA